MSVTPQPPLLLHGTRIVEHLLGCWPGFQDAEVLSVYLDRAGAAFTLHMLVPFKLNLPGAEATIAQIMVRFDNVRNLTINGFDHRNIIKTLVFSNLTERSLNAGAEEERLRVEIVAKFGMSCSFSCAGGEILGATSIPSRAPTMPDSP